LLPAQVDLLITGGSLPGTIEGRLGPYQAGFPALVVFGVTTGPIPLAIIDARDPRVLRVGPEFLDLAFSGAFGGDTYYRTPSIPVPNQPWFVNRSLFFQGLTLEGSAFSFLVGSVSDPRAVWFAPAFTFHNRGTQMTQARAFFDRAVPIVGGRWIVAAGGSGALLSQAALASSDIYDPMTDAFFAGPSLNTARSVHTVTRLPDGKWLFAAGVDTNNDPQNTSEVFDPDLLMFRTVPNAMNAHRMGHTANLLTNGRVLVTGGLSDLNGGGIAPISSALASTEIYNPQTDTWTAGPNMSRPRAGHIAIPLPDGRILFAGGVGYTTIIIPIPQIWTQCEIYNPTTNTFANAASMQTARAIAAVADLGGGRFLVAGGSSAILSGGTPTSSCEIYNSSTNTWSNAGSMAAARGMSGVAPLGSGRFLFFGGADGSLTAPNSLSSAEVYDAASNAFTPAPSLTLTRAAFGTFHSPTGQFHVIGGGTGTTGTSTTTAEWFYR
jgi:hypothetical protein